MPSSKQRRQERKGSFLRQWLWVRVVSYVIKAHELCETGAVNGTEELLLTAAILPSITVEMEYVVYYQGTRN